MKNTCTHKPLKALEPDCQWLAAELPKGVCPNCGHKEESK